MRHDPTNPTWDQRDIFILSKGHAALGFYNVLAQYGYFAPSEVHAFGAFQSKFGCHPDRFKVPGVEMSTGSLGHGIAVAVGIALAFRLQRSQRRVYTLIGDGEANEGTIWESVMVASHLKLQNLTILYDNNQSQIRSLPIPNPAERLAAFGCDVVQADGHDLEQLKHALRGEAKTVKAVVANTIKGYPCPLLSENVFEWHRKSPDPAQLERLLGELDAQAV
jgi:transketolase